MTSSGDSSPTSPVAPPRKRFVLSGRSARLDPLHHAVRGDLADLALADRVFAPHYARATPYRVRQDVTVRTAASEASDMRAELRAGDAFHVLDLSGGWLWGHADDPASVGYIPAASAAPA